MSEFLHLIADIGGTNARFALVENFSARAIEPRNLPCADYETIVDATLAYLDLVGLGKPYQAAISIASPVTGIRFTFSRSTISQIFTGSKCGSVRRRGSTFRSTVELSSAGCRTARMTPSSSTWTGRS